MRKFSQACENNKGPILEVLQRYLSQDEVSASKQATILEIGSGTGQHAVFFSQHLPWLQWQTADLAQSFDSINAWRDEAGSVNCLAPLELDLRESSWLSYRADNIFTANTLHIVSAELVARLINGAAAILDDGGYLFVYGPFSYNGRFTSNSNARFNEWLQQRDPDSAIRDFETVNGLAQKAGLRLVEDNAMPANNRLLVFRMQAG